MPPKNISEEKPNDRNPKEDDLPSFDEKLEILDNQIHLINAKLNEPSKKSWLASNLSLIVSMAALLTSLIFSYYGVLRDKEKDLQESEKTEAAKESQRIDEINKLILELTELQENNIRLSAENPNVDVNGLSVITNYRRLIFVNKILDLIDSTNHVFPPEAYSLLGFELRNDGQFKKALEYFDKELEVSKTANQKVVAYRELASIFGTPETGFQNLDSSRYLWSRSISLSDSIVGENKYNFIGYGYQLWASNEFYFGDAELALQLVDSSKSAYLKLPSGNTAKDFNIRRLNQLVEFYNTRHVNSRLGGLAGVWNTSSKAKLNAKINFYQNINGVFCNVEFYEFNKLSYNLTGPFLTLTDRYMTFNLQGVKKFFNGMVSASLKVYPNPQNSNVLYIKLDELNEETKEFTVRKL